MAGQKQKKKDAAPRIALKGICRSFPGIVANDDVTMSVAPGEIHALVGENGAGKSTLVKMLYGVLKPDAGQIYWDGEPVTIDSPKTARYLGIGMVFQHFSLFEAMTVLENIALGLDEPVPRRRLESRIRDILHTYNLPLDPRRAVHTLSAGERQRIEIVRALLLRPKLLIMDEPTSVLTPQEIEHLFKTLRRISEEGCSILYISHKLEEVKRLCDSATILRAGRKVAKCNPGKTSARKLAEMMIGSELKDVARQATAPSRKREVRLSVEGLSLAPSSLFGTPLAEIAFSVQAGEIFGIAGIAGNGQNELFAALSGERPCAPGVIRIGGISAGDKSPSSRRALGLCALPEERNGHAAVPSFTLWENLVLTGRRTLALTSAGLIRRRRARRFSGEVISRFDVRTTGVDAEASSLSGGNLQKFVLGREIAQNPRILVVAQPTWGVDAGAAVTVRQAIADLAAAGTAIVLISQDLDELLLLADTVAVINQGRLTEMGPAATVSVERIGMLMGGIHGEPAVVTPA
ncbi:MAG: ABC transporter ATP-binding protein [Rhodobiaceae bacterium]|nr:ABC transporter ATP-binding protein [Rhodobiaceae bacterium]MCC0055166.1 ABC transporter ATP-binding protein [Rhodobiaceae bacterium]